METRASIKDRCLLMEELCSVIRNNTSLNVEDTKEMGTNLSRANEVFEKLSVRKI